MLPHFPVSADIFRLNRSEESSISAMTHAPRFSTRFPRSESSNPIRNMKAILTSHPRVNAPRDRAEFRCDLAISTRDAGRCTAVVVHATSKMTHTHTRPRAHRVSRSRSQRALRRIHGPTCIRRCTVLCT